MIPQTDQHEVEVLTRRIREALIDIPVTKQPAVYGRMAEVMAQFLVDSDPAPVSHFLRSLMATSRLHSNPAYLKGLARAEEADAQRTSEPEGSGSVADFVEEMRARRG